MQTTQKPGYQDLFGQTITDMANAIATRPNEDDAKRQRRAAAAVRSIMGFQPRDAAEVMLAGHAVMYHEVIVDNIRRTLHGEPEQTGRATRANIAAMDRAYQSSLRHLRLYQKRPGEGSRDADLERTEARIAPAAAETRAISPKPAPVPRPAPVAETRPPAPPDPTHVPVDVIRMVPRGSAGLPPSAPGLAPVCMTSPLAAQAVVSATGAASFRLDQSRPGRAPKATDIGSTR